MAPVPQPLNLASHGFPNTFLQSGAPLSHQFDPSPQIPCFSVHTHRPPSNLNPAPQAPCPSNPTSLSSGILSAQVPQARDFQTWVQARGPPDPRRAGAPSPGSLRPPQQPQNRSPTRSPGPGLPDNPACGYFRPQTPRPPGTWVPQARGPTDPRRAGPSGLGPLLPHPPRLAHLPRGLTRAGQCG